MLLAKPGDVAPVRNQPSLPYQQVPELMAKLATREGVGARATALRVASAKLTVDVDSSR